jgi:all-trans-retinol dehydrogenase (NAD+)
MNEVLASKTMIVNAESNMWTVREFLPSMLKKNSGHVVSISSVAGMTGCAGMTDYCASKFAAFGFSESLRIEMKILGKNVKCTTICPFFINTGMFAGVKPGLVSGFLD